MELTLGTVSFGLKYGVANSFRQVEQHEALQIIDLALKAGILAFDTATAYGDAESILGQATRNMTEVRVNTKLSEHDCMSASTIVESVRRSLGRVGHDEFEAVLIHNPATLFRGDQREIKMGLQDVINLGLSKAIGFSAYGEDEVIMAKELFPELTVFQLPENICDQRSFNSRALMELAQNGNTFSVRSIFLQGVLLMNLENIPRGLSSLHNEVRDFRAYLKSHRKDAVEACIGYAKTIPWASQLVVGANSVEQLRELTRVFHLDVRENYSDAPRISENWLDPRTWPQG